MTKQRVTLTRAQINEITTEHLERERNRLGADVEHTLAVISLINQELDWRAQLHRCSHPRCRRSKRHIGAHIT